MKKNKKILRNLLIIAIIVYIAFVFIDQQKTLNEYSKNTEELNQQIASEKATNEDLNQQKDNVNSLEFIEEMARDKLDMYYPCLLYTSVKAGNMVCKN